MSSITAREAIEFFRSYEINCDKGLIQEWLNKLKRLLLEIQQLEKENETLHKEILRLELEFGISPFD